MAATVGSLQVRVGADITGLKTGMTQAQLAVANSARAMKVQANDLKLTFAEVATASSRAWRVFLGGAAILGTARAVINATDAFKSLQAQLRLATSQYGSFEQANKDVQAIAERSRSDLLSTAELYAALQRNADQFGGTQAQVARITETVAKAFKISGASADEASNATRQLVQAFQSGRLQGDEFRSMMENAPRLARLLADSLGITVGKLRQMSKEGKLTADVLARAFSDQRFTATIDAEFKQLPVTFDQAMNQLYNAAVVTFGEFDQGGQFSTALANFITDGSEGFQTLGDRAFRFGAEVRGISDALDSVKDAFGSVHTTGLQGLLGLDDATVTLVGTIGTLLDVLDATIQKFADLARAPYNLIQAITGGQLSTGNITNFGGNFRADVNARRNDATRRQIMGRSAADVLGEFGLGKRPPPFHPTATGGGGTAKKPPKDRSADIEAQFESEIRQANMDILRAKQDLLHDSEQRAAVEIQLLELERQNENAAIDEKVRRAKQDLADKRITETAYKKVVADAEILKSKNDEAARLKTQAVLDEITHQRAEDRAKLVQVDFEIQQDSLRSQEQLAETASERRKIELELLDLAYRQEKARLEAVIADEQSSAAAKEEARRRLAGLSANYATNRAGVMASTRGPYEDWFASLPTTADKAQEAFERLETQGFDGLIDAALALTDGFKSAKDALLNTLKQFFLGLARMELQKGLAQLLPAGGFKIPGLASGGEGVFGGLPGIDRNVLSLNGIPFARVSYGERFSVSNDNVGSGGGRGDTYMTVVTPDANSFRRSDRQIAREWNRRLGSR
jgi:tape measure domain-containing protein